ncbi:hypothetical protein BC827DRAFT_1267198 [Russula dissimulans]|nr:hypothetical protein BC827DRAFT_1267198 [Russula dissimulans]
MPPPPPLPPPPLPPRHSEDILGDESGDLQQRFPPSSGAVSSHENNTVVDNNSNLNDTYGRTSSVCNVADTTNTANAADATDIADADTFEFLNQGPIVPAVFIPEEAEPVEVQLPEEQLNPAEAANLEPVADLVIESLPFGKPSAPIDCARQGPSMYEMHQSMFGDSSNGEDEE